MTTTAKVGAEVQAQCGRCHDATSHKILTVEKSRPKRAQCVVCNASHLYRTPKGPEEPRPKGKGRRSTKDDPQVVFEKALKAAGDVPAVTYKITGQFQEGQRLQHKSFGEGVVIRIVRPQVMEVVFKDATRKLAMER